MTENLKIEDLEDVPTQQLTLDDADKLDGQKPLIASVTTEKFDSKYEVNPHSPDFRKELQDGKMVEAWRVIIETEPYGKELIGRNITTKQRFNLKINPNTGAWGPSLHEKSPCKMLFNKLKINKFPDAKGKPIVVLKKISNKGNAYMTFGI